MEGMSQVQGDSLNMPISRIISNVWVKGPSPIEYGT